MAGATLATVDAALIETWTEKDLAEQLYQSNPFLERVKRLKSTQVGQQALTAIHTGRNTGYTAFPATGATLNAAGNQSMAQAAWQYTHHAMQIKLEGSAIDATANDKLAIANLVDVEVNGAIDDLNRNLSRQCFSAGDALVCDVHDHVRVDDVVLDPVTGFNAIERGWLAVGTVRSTSAPRPTRRDR
jgi:hypothetical protein